MGFLFKLYTYLLIICVPDNNKNTNKKIVLENLVNIYNNKISNKDVSKYSRISINY